MMGVRWVKEFEQGEGDDDEAEEERERRVSFFSVA